MRKLSEDPDGEVILSCDICELSLDDGIKLLDTEYFIEPFEEAYCQLFREGMRGRDLESARGIFPLKNLTH